MRFGELGPVLFVAVVFLALVALVGSEIMPFWPALMTGLVVTGVAFIWLIRASR